MSESSSLTSQLFFLLVDLLFLRMNTFTVWSVLQWSSSFFIDQLKFILTWPKPCTKGTLLQFCPFMGHMNVSQGASVGQNLKQLTLILWTHMEQSHPCTSGPTTRCQEPRTARKHVGRQSRTHSGPTSATWDTRSCDSLYYCLKRWLCSTVTHPSAWLMCVMAWCYRACYIMQIWFNGPALIIGHVKRKDIIAFQNGRRAKGKLRAT